MHEPGISGNGDRAEPIFEVREDIGGGFGVNNFDEEGVLLDAIVEAIEVEEMDWVAIVVDKLGDPEVSCIGKGVPEVKRLFYFLSSLCM